jgi:hypothetical protein
VRSRSGPPSAHPNVFRRNPGLRFALSPAQLAQVETVAATLPTEYARHSFKVRVSAKLVLAAPVGGVLDELLDAAIDAVLREYAEGIWAA